LLAWARTPESRATFAFILLYKLGDSAMAPMTRPFLLAQGLDAGEVGLLTSTVGAVLVSVGALGGGLLLERSGLRTGALVLGGAQAASNLVYAGCAATGGRAAAIGASMTESLTSGLGTAASLAVVLAASAGGDGRQAATRFAALSMVTALTRTLAGAISGVAVEQVGYAEWFGLTFLLAVPALLLVPRVAAAHDTHTPQPA
jgi:PAT family beta-lactamase induction signal transducer AmpG